MGIKERKHALGLYVWSVIYAIIVTIIWTLVVHYVGLIWVGSVLNIVGFLWTVAILGSLTLPALKVLMPTPLAWLCAIVTWVVAVGLLRSLIAA